MPTFGGLLKRLRKRVGMTQEDLAAAIGYSRSLVAALEANRRLPDVEQVIGAYVPALGLQDDPVLAVQLVELAATARGQRPPPTFAFERERQPARTSAEAEPQRLPVPPTDILGREQEIRDLCNRLLGHHGRLLTLVGPPGVGKTRLAQAVGTQLQTFYQNGACFAALAAVTDPLLVAPALLSTLRVQDSSARPAQTRLIEYLRRKELLLVLDNLEQLLAAPSPAPSPAVDLVAELLAECPDLRILVTSRERLHLRSEQRYRVPPLSLAAAVDLFDERCQAVDPAFALTTANRPTVEAICQQLDRLPLALELCAAQIDLFSPAQLLARLRDRRLELLVNGPHDLPPRQRTLRSAIAHSYNLLDEDERRLLRALGVFVGGCDLKAIEAVAAWDQEAADCPLLPSLQALIGKSLVHSVTLSGAEVRYMLLETIREFALEQVRAGGEEDGLRQRHFAAYLQLFRTADARLRGSNAAVWLARLEPEQDNLRAALQWALDTGRYADAAWLLMAAWWFWFAIGQWMELGKWVDDLLPHRETLPPDLRLGIFINMHSVARAFEESRLIERYTAEMIGLLKVCSDRLLQTGAWHFAAIYAADLAEASAAWERAIECARAASEAPRLSPDFGVMSDRDFMLGHCLWSYAERLIDHGEFARAVPLLAETSRLFQARGSRYETADSLGTAGRLALLQGDLTKARALLQEAVTVAKNFHYHEMVATFQPYLGLVTLYLGDLAEARGLLAGSLRICLDLKDKSLLARVCACLAETSLCEGELDEAANWLAQSLVHQADPQRIRVDQVQRLIVAARLASAQGAYVRAATLFGLAERVRSQTHYEPVGVPRLLAKTALERVRGALDPGLFDDAFKLGEQMSLEEAFATILAPAP